MARPREFDVDEALHSALLIFWRNGFDATSLTDLADGMGIARPSLQAAYGSKEDLYRKAIDLYGREAMAFVSEAVRGATAAEVCRRYLSGYCDMLCDLASPPGCFMIKGLVSCGRGASIARDESLARQRSYEALLEQRFGQSLRDGDLPVGSDPQALAACLSTVANGLAVRADMGTERAELGQIAEACLTSLLPDAGSFRTSSSPTSVRFGGESP